MDLTQVQLMLTERCNLRCKHCAVPAENSPADHEVDSTEWCRVIGLLSAAGLDDLILSGGELTLRSDALDLARCAHDSGIRRTTIVTNGTRISLAWASEVSALQREYRGLQLHVSLDGASAETHDWMRGGGTFCRTLEGMSQVLEADGRIDGLQLCVHRRNVH